MAFVDVVNVPTPQIVEEIVAVSASFHRCVLVTNPAQIVDVLVPQWARGRSAWRPQEQQRSYGRCLRFRPKKNALKRQMS